MIESSTSTIFISGDTGYDQHFATIGKNFPHIDLAIIEFGQYGQN
jgi:L-ascorbate metabolism protein UlaG (beta-lactamase superfamily)